VCTLCRAGKIQLCAKKRSPGWGIDGAFTDYLVIPDLFLHHIPENVPDNIAALAEPMAIVTHSVLERGRVEPQDVITVIGAGPIGLLSAVAAKAGGASKVIVLGTDADEERRFPAARKLGIDHVINVMRENASEIINGLTKGEGVDMVVEASGSEAGINTAIDIVKRCGRICVIGMPGRDRVSVQWLKMINKVLDVNFNLSSSVSSWERALSIMARTPSDLSCIITHYADIQDWERVFDDIEKGKAIKAFFIPRTSQLKEKGTCASE
jgi:threonine dehydrogenase-like Zn-dependent dehydrogenase